MRFPPRAGCFPAGWPLAVFATLGCCLALQLAAVSAVGEPPIDETRVDYNRQIKPLLADRCYTCHGPDKEHRKAALRLDVRESAVADVIVPGDVEESYLYERVSAEDPRDVMPPADSGRKPLAKHEVELIRRWIEQGAKFDTHWAFVRVTRPDVPDGRDGDWAFGPIDHFIAAAHRREGLKPSPEADRRTLIRRLSFDLTGLPPTPEEVDRFLEDDSPQAYEKAVDRLLASEHYGERMAVFWLDVVRYADTGGYHSDNHRDVWAYRDYVIDAFNRNEPFDRFTIEQLAGDLIEEPTPQSRIASGYNKLLMTTEEGGAQPKEYQAKYAADRTRNTAAAWLGVTLGCAECHDHKFDPLLTKEFYQFSAFFADVKEKSVGRQDQTTITIEEGQRVSTLVTEAVSPRVSRILPRGNWLDDTGEVVEPGVPAALGTLDVADGRATRLDLADWFVTPENPLVARVLVNRLWQLYFGQGLVTTPDDFGSQGAQPTHPQLLDWLAAELIESGWDVKNLVRLIVTSRAYRLSSQDTDAQRSKDPTNRFLARQARFRLDAEFVRDNALAISGLLVPKIGGPSVKPYQPAGYWQHLNFPKRVYKADEGENQYRRGLYTYWQRTFIHPSLKAFDATSREQCTVQRPRSNTPLQNLVLLNDPSYVEAARVLAQRVLRDGGDDEPQRVNFAVRQALGRDAQPPEIEILVGLLKKHAKSYADDEVAAKALIGVGQAKPPEDIDAAELAAWTSVARVILNLHETITRY